MILQACIFEIVTTQVEQVPVPDWAFAALGRPVEKRNFRYADMLYPDGRRANQWGQGASVPDVSRPETKLWFYFLAASYIDLGIEAIHFGQAELMNGNDRDLRPLVAGADADPVLRGQARPQAHGALRLPRSQRRPGARRTFAHGLPFFPAADQGGSRQAARGDFASGVLRRHLRPEQGRPDIQRLEVRAPAVSGGDSTTGASAGSRARRRRAASGSGATTRSPGSPTRAKSIAPTGCAMPGTGCARRTPTATCKCPAAAPCDHL